MGKAPSRWRHGFQLDGGAGLINGDPAAGTEEMI